MVKAPIQGVLSSVGLGALGSLSGVGLGLFVEVGALTSLGVGASALAGVSFLDLLNNSVGVDVWDALNNMAAVTPEQIANSLNTGVALGVVGVAISLGIMSTKLIYMGVELGKNTSLIKTIFQATKGEGKHLEKLTRAVNRKIKRKWKKDDGDAPTLKVEEVAKTLAEADLEGSLCDGSLKKSKRAQRRAQRLSRQDSKYLKKRLATRSDIKRWMVQSVLEKAIK